MIPKITEMLSRYLLFLLLTLSFIFHGLCSYAQFSGVKWEQRIYFETPTAGYYARNPSIKKIITTTNNETIVCWQLTGEHFPVSNYMYVEKYAADGGKLWNILLETGGNYTRSFGDAVPTEDGGAVILSLTGNGYFGYDSGFVDGESLYQDNAILHKLTNGGTIEWQQVIKGKRREDVTSLSLDRFGNILVSGQTWSAYDDFEGKRRFVDSNYWATDLESRYRFRESNNDAFIAKFSPSGAMINLKCYGGSLSDKFIHVQDHPVYGYVAIGYSESKDYDLPAQGTNNGIWMVRLDTALNITQQIILDSSDTFFSRFFIKNKRLFLSNFSTFRELGFDGTIIREHSVNNILFDQHSFFDKSGYIYSPVQNKRINVYDSSLQLLHTLQLPGVDHGYYLIDGTSRSNIYLIGKAKFNYRYDYRGYILYDVHSNAVLNFSDLYNYITGKIFVDANNNNQYDVGEKIINGVKIQGIKDTLITSFFHEGTDDYYLNVDTGNYVVKAFTTNLNYTVSPVSKSVYFASYNNSVDTINFALQPIPNKKDLSINLLPLNIARPGFPVQYQLICTNQGTETISNVQVKFVQNPRVNFVSSSPVVNTTVGDTLIWNIASMKPFDTSYINLDLRIAAPPVVNNTDTLLFKSFVFPLIADETPEDNQFNLVQQVQGSYDPNDKTETHGGIITPEQLAGDEFLTYLIRFQNTGTDTAFTVMIRDTLTNKLDWSSFEMLSSSHPYQLYMIKPHILEFSFSNILLVDSNKNEPASHGFVAYRIKPKSNLSVGDTVLNRAHIYFDYNLPVITNDELTVLRNTVITSVVDLNRPVNQLLLYPNPSTGLVTIFRKGRLNGTGNLQIIDLNGKIVYRSNLGLVATEQFNQTIDISKLFKGLYVISLQVGKEMFRCRFIIQ